MAADQLEIPREGDVALDDAGAHAGGGIVGFTRVLGKLQGCAAMSNREVGSLERPLGAGSQLVLERPLLHIVHEEERARSELNVSTVRGVVR